MFYVLAMLLMYILSMGPEPRFLGTPFMYRAPYSWLMRLPGFDAIRAPARFAMLAVLCLSVAAGLSFARLMLRYGNKSHPSLASPALAEVPKAR